MRLHPSIVAVFAWLILAPPGGLAGAAAEAGRDAAAVERSRAERPQQIGAASQAGKTTLKIFLRGAPIGSEELTVVRDGDDWVISSAGSLGAPMHLVTERFQVRYGADWQPKELAIEAHVRGQPIAVQTSFSQGTAVSRVTQDGRETEKTDPVSAGAVVLPNNVYAAYEALAVRLASMDAGAELPVYVAPQAEIRMRLREVADEHMQTVGASLRARRHDVVFENPGGPLAVSVWTDPAGRLLRVTIPAVQLDVAREDVATIMTRREPLKHPGGEDVMVPAAGFNLAATITRPPHLPAPPPRRSVRVPAVVLVAGSGPQDRDETVAGIPIFGQLAGALADAGFIVARYDKRGVGQSGGRHESATLSDYADDVRSVVEHLRRRRDVDSRRIALVGHSEGAWVAMLAASRDRRRIAAVALLAGAGTDGAELVLEQQQRALARLTLPDAERQAKIALQRRIQAAVTGDGEWEEVPLELRRQADTPWFRSFLTFDPAEVMPRLRQPVLIVQPMLDSQVPPHHADRLEQLARARRRDPSVDVVRVEGVNHLLVRARTGEGEEYGRLEERTVSADLLEELVGWLRGTLKS